MGFIPKTSVTASATSASATSLTCTFAGGLMDGDLIFAIFASGSGPANAWSTPSGWNTLVAVKNATLSVGGSVAIFYKTWRNGDSLAVTSTISVAAACAAAAIAVRADTDGASVQRGNPPSGGFTSGFDQENTTAGTSHTVPRCQVDETRWDMRLIFAALAATGAGTQTFVPPMPAQAADNLFRTPPLQLISTVVLSRPSVFIYCDVVSDPSGLDAGTTTWTSAFSVKSYVVSAVLGESGASSGYQGATEVDVDLADMPLEAVGLEEVVTVTQGGGGGGISVF